MLILRSRAPITILAPILILGLSDNNRLVRIAPFGTLDKTMGFKFDGLDLSFERPMHRATIPGGRSV